MGWNGNLCFCNVVAQLWPALWDPMDLEPARLFHPWTYPGKQIGVRSHSLLQGSFPIKESNLRLLLGRLILYHWATWETQTVLNKSLFIKHCQAKLQKNGCLLPFYFWFICLSWLHQIAYRLLRPQPGLTSGPQPWKHRAPTTGSPGNFQISTLLNVKIIMT